MSYLTDRFGVASLSGLPGETCLVWEVTSNGSGTWPLGARFLADPATVELSRADIAHRDEAAIAGFVAGPEGSFPLPVGCARRIDDESWFVGSTQADASGYFLLRGLEVGVEYEISVNVSPDKRYPVLSRSCVAQTREHLAPLEFVVPGTELRLSCPPCDHVMAQQQLGDVELAWRTPYEGGTIVLKGAAEDHMTLRCRRKDGSVVAEASLDPQLGHALPQDVAWATPGGG